MISHLQIYWQLRGWRKVLDRALVVYLSELHADRHGDLGRFANNSELLAEAEECLTWVRGIE